MKNKNKGAVLVTGASSGIGRATVKLLDRSGYRVFAGIRNDEDKQRLEAEGSERLTPVFLDISEADQIDQAVKTLTDGLEPDVGLAGLVNNAGVGFGGPLEFLPIEDFRRQIEVNVIGHVAMTQAFLPLIRKGQGRIINMGSMAGRIALPFSGPYAASKFAMEAISDALRRELIWWDIPVVLIEPGSVTTPIWEKSFQTVEKRARALPEHAQVLYEKPLMAMNDYMKKLVSHGIPPESVAKIVLRAMGARKPKTRYVVGLDARLGLLSQFLPDRLIDQALKREQKRLG